MGLRVLDGLAGFRPLVGGSSLMKNRYVLSFGNTNGRTWGATFYVRTSVLTHAMGSGIPKLTNETQQLVKVLVLESQRGGQHYGKRCLRHDPGLEPRPQEHYQ